VESVAWATERRDVLSGLFFLLTILSYLRYVALPEGAPGRKGWYVTTVVLYVCCLLSKATGVTLPLVLVVLDVYPLRCIQSKSGSWWNPTTERVLVEKIPFLMLAMAAGAIALAGQSQAGAMMGLAGHGVLARILVAIAGVGFYVYKTILPIGLSPMYELPSPLLLGWIELSVGTVLAVTLTAGALAVRRRLPGLTVAWLCYVVMLLPMLGFVQVGVQMAADRYSYLPGLSLALVIGGLVLGWWRRSQGDDPGAIFRAPVVVVVIAAALLAPLTWRQCTYWHNDITLWTRALEADRFPAVAAYNLGAAWDRRLNERTRAIEAYRWAVKLRPDYLLAWQNLGNALLMDGKSEEAMRAYQEVLRRQPRRADLLANMSLAFLQLGRLDDAVQKARDAISIDPDYAVAHNNLGEALKQKEVLKPKRNFGEAMQAYRQAMEVDPTYSQAYENLFRLLVVQERFGEATDVLRLAVKHMPDHLKMANNLAFVLATCKTDEVRDGPEALRLALRVCKKTKYREAQYLDTLAAAYAENGDFAKAEQTIQRAVSLISVTDPRTAAIFGERRRQYQKRLPLRRGSY
jgi:Flp pilus assembly protein TadD